jgi:beta-aspartyl-peptidase (threonine type)
MHALATRSAFPLAAFVLLGVATIAPGAVAQPTAPAGGPDDPVVLVVHGGAGALRRGGYTAEQDAAVRAGIEGALRAGHAALADGRPALDAVQAAIETLEDDPLFNAGRGAVLSADGIARHDASVMDGATGMAGASSGTMHVRHPIRLARAVMDHSPHVLLTAEGAEEFALLQGLEMMPNDWFVTDRARAALDAVQERERSTRGDAGPGLAPEPWQMTGTVGAVALDAAGHLAAGTSTGGMTNKRWGRVGDAPVVGAGTYASDATVGVSATGHGEYFIRLAVAHDIHARVLYLGETADEAARHVIGTTLTEAGGTGGVIVLDRAGRASMPFNTDGMSRGTITRSGRVTVAIYADE